MGIPFGTRARRLGATVTLAVIVGGCGSRADDVEVADVGPAAGETVAVVGIEHATTLPLRSAPGPDQPIVASLGPLADDLVTTGRGRQLTSALWFEVAAGGVTGWADSAFLAYLGATRDATASIVAKLGRYPTADSMVELGRIVAMAEASAAPRSRMTITDAPTVGEIGKVTYDVLGLDDDSVRGMRLKVWGVPGATFTLRTAEATALCSRGVTGSGQCV